jgi:polar amino acid transport system substrate-binding protein
MQRTSRSLALVAALGLLVSACAGGGDVAEEPTATEAPAAEAPAGPSCAREDLTLVADGVLTIGTDDPAFPPWFDFDPTSGNGYESAVAYAVAEELGFARDEVVWITVPFNASYAPGPKDFDFDINQISITPERAEVVTFSDGYYTVNQALVGYTDSVAATIGSVAELKALRLGAQVGTTSLTFITEVIQPDTEPLVYDTNNDAKSALEAGQLDAIVLDLPTAFYVSAVEIEEAEVIGQFPPVGDAPEQFGMLFELDNPLADCVNEALARLRDSGTLAAIEQEWLADATGAPVIALSASY